MKKFAWFLAAVMLLFLLSACGDAPAEDAPFDWPDPPQMEQKNDSLTVYCLDVGKGARMMEKAVTLFRASHPGVRVELVQEDFDAGQGYDAYQQVAAEIMAGGGPDVILVNDSLMDVEKMVRQGVFADMEPFFEADGFDWTPYNQTIMDGGVWDGRRYMVPLSYDFPLYVTTRTALEETGFDVDACKDFRGFLEESRRFMADSSQTRRLFYERILTPAVWDAGLLFADYDGKTVDLSSPDLKDYYEWKKLLAAHVPDGYLIGNDLCAPAAVRDGEVLWASGFYASSTFYFQYGALKTIGEAVMMPIRDLNGGIQAQIKYPVAVRANSENLQNAYDFLKIVLGKDVQGGFASFSGGEELSVLDQVNEEYYHNSSITPDGWESMAAGTQGFTSTVSEFYATDWPTQEEFEAFMGYAGEISGTYYSSHLGLNSAMSPFVSEGADYDETLENAQRTLEIQISE